jgi:Natural resistance-associated macrophage protein
MVPAPISGTDVELVPAPVNAIVLAPGKDAEIAFQLSGNPGPASTLPVNQAGEGVGPLVGAERRRKSFMSVPTKRVGPSRALDPNRLRLIRVLGPGLITGASDDDPSGIATYSQAGAQFGFAISWTMLFSYPLMVAIQQISARIGRITGKGIAGNLRQHYPNWLLEGTARRSARFRRRGRAMIMEFKPSPMVLVEGTYGRGHSL